MRQINGLPSLSPGAMAEYFRLRFVCGRPSLEELEHWAVEEIRKQNNPPYSLLELATTTHKKQSEIVSLLGNLPRSKDETSQALATLCHHWYCDLMEGQSSLEEVLLSLTALNKLGESPESLEHDIRWLDVQFHLAQDNVWGTKKEVLGSALTILEKHSLTE